MKNRVKIHAVLSSAAVFLVCGCFVFFFSNFINSLNAAVSHDTQKSYSFTEDAGKKANASRIRYVTRNVVAILQSRHYRSQPFNDDFSHKVFEKYLEMLDPARIYFTEEDLKRFGRRYNTLDDDLEKGNADFAFEVYDLFKSRMAEYREFAENLLKKDFDFSVNENIILDRSKVPRPANKNEMHELWRKRLKNEILNLRMYEKMMAENHDGKESDEEKRIEKIRALWGSKDPKVKILNLLKDINNDIMQKNVLDVLDIYLTAVAQVYGPHSSYLSPKSDEDFDIRMSLSLSGIGATLTSEDGLIRIVEIVPGGPAALDGRLKVEDRIIGVGQGKDGKIVDVVNMSVANAVKLIRGKEGSVVRLAILPGDKGKNAKPQIIEIVRQKIELKESGAKGSVRTVGTGADAKKIGVIFIPSFYMDFEGAMSGKKDYRSVTRDVNNILQDFNKQKVDAVVVDLRSNGGGSLVEAIQLAGLFINGPVVQIRDRSGRFGVREDMDKNYIAYNGPLVVLNSRMSASASEIFSGAMRDHQRALIVGDSTSFGKGTVLEVVKLNDLFSLIPINFDAGSLQYESAVFYRVNGSSVQQLGISADIVIPSLSEVMEIGERFSKNHLPWDEINPCKYKPYYQNFDDILSSLRRKSAQRVAADKFFAAVKKEQDIYTKYRKENRRTLNEKERYKEYFAEKKIHDESRRPLNEKDSRKKVKNDGVLDEAVNIAADFASFVKGCVMKDD